MTRRRPLLLPVILAFAAAASACRTPVQSAPSASVPSASQSASGPLEPIRITLAATNDLHGWVHPHTLEHDDGTVLEEGGLATLSGYISILRAQNPGGVLLLDGGDLFQGTLASNLTEGEVVIDAYNHLGYTAAAIGNHEFDYGPLGPVSVASGPDVDAFGALKARLAQAKFPLLAVNIYEASSGERPGWLPDDGSLMVEIKGVRIGILGLVTPTTPHTTNPVNVSSLRFGSLVPEAAAAAKRLRDRGAELVIGVAHAGGKCGSCEDPKDLSTCDTQSGEIFELLLQLPPGTVDAMIAGHTHQELAHFVNGTPVVETRALGRALAVVELFVDPETRRVLPDQTVLSRNVAVCPRVDKTAGTCELSVLKQLPKVELVPASYRGQPVVVDAALQKKLSPALARVEAAQRRKLGLTVPRALWRNYEAESALGDFLADSLRTMEKADVVLLNSGGLRADLPAGELTYGDLYEVIPFDNTVSTLTLTGEELRRLLHAAYGARKGVFQVSGLQVKLGRCPGQTRLKSFSLANGRSISPDKKYRVVMPDFLARGGDGLGPVVASVPASRIDLGMSRELNFRDAMVAFWQARGEPLVAPEPGRISFVDDGAGCSSGETLGHP
ncbi:MAG: bifunctional UDP-sugar hydrolase/5'-nucleotidase [Myxococcaceae bacterium]